MATGAGKTYTAATLSYRLLAHAGFRRILFLADRANLVRQARDEYLAYRPLGTGRSFAELYNVQKLGRPDSIKARRSSSPRSSASTRR